MVGSLGAAICKHPEILILFEPLFNLKNEILAFTQSHRATPCCTAQKCKSLWGEPPPYISHDASGSLVVSDGLEGGGSIFAIAVAERRGLKTRQ